MRQLKHHEKKLLKKVDFLQWKKDDDVREIKIIRRYHLQKREDYHKYVTTADALNSTHSCRHCHIQQKTPRQRKRITQANNSTPLF